MGLKEGKSITHFSFARDSSLVIDGYMECVTSTDPEIVISTFKVLPEISVLAAGLLICS